MDLPDFTQALVAFDRKWRRHVGAGLREAGGELTLIEEAVLESLAFAGDDGLAGPQVIDQARVDKAHVARALERLRGRQWVKSTRDGQDARLNIHQLTARGWGAYRAVGTRRHERLAERVGDMLPDARREIADALASVGAWFDDRNPWRPLVIREAGPGDYGWVIERHGAIYSSEFHYDETFEAFVAEGVARFVRRHDARREKAFIAERDGRRVACAFVVRESAKVARLRFFLVDPGVRGLGVGGRLLDHALAFSRRGEDERMVLWTQSHLETAIRLYKARGFRKVKEEAHPGFGRPVRAQEWALDLKEPAK